jgi:hypothetical protein
MARALPTWLAPALVWPGLDAPQRDALALTRARPILPGTLALALPGVPACLGARVPARSPARRAGPGALAPPSPGAPALARSPGVAQRPRSARPCPRRPSSACPPLPARRGWPPARHRCSRGLARSRAARLGLARPRCLARGEQRGVRVARPRYGSFAMRLCGLARARARVVRPVPWRGSPCSQRDA